MGVRIGGALLRGAIAGTIGAWVMDRATWALQDREPRAAIDHERAAWPEGRDVSHELARRLGKAAGATGEVRQPGTAGMMTHYLLGIGPAVLYSVLRTHDRRFAADGGLLYGTAVFALWDECLAAASGIAGPPRAYPWQAHLRGLAGHLALGLATHVALTALETDFDVRPVTRHPGA